MSSDRPRPVLRSGLAQLIEGDLVEVVDHRLKPFYEIVESTAARQRLGDKVHRVLTLNPSGARW